MVGQKGWVINGDQSPLRRKHHQGGRDIIIWAGSIGEELIGSVRVPQGVKLTYGVPTYCQFVKNLLEALT